MRVDIYVEYAKKSAICPECGEPGGIHDRLEERSWRHLDTMQFVTEIHARTPRVSCPRHGVKVIELPWASKSSRFTLLFEAFAIDVLKAAKSVADAQKVLRLSWRQAQSIMAAAVRRGMARRGAEEIPFVGMDGKSFRHGRKADDFACVMTDVEGRRVLDVGRGRSGEGAKQLIGKAPPRRSGILCAARRSTCRRRSRRPYARPSRAPTSCSTSSTSRSA